MKFIHVIPHWLYIKPHSPKPISESSFRTNIYAREVTTQLAHSQYDGIAQIDLSPVIHPAMSRVRPSFEPLRGILTKHL